MDLRVVFFTIWPIDRPRRWIEAKGSELAAVRCTTVVLFPSPHPPSSVFSFPLPPPPFLLLSRLSPPLFLLLHVVAGAAVVAAVVWICLVAVVAAAVAVVVIFVVPL